MSEKCPKCKQKIFIRSNYGHFIRLSDKKKILRFRCRSCSYIYSQASFQDCYRQKKRRLNPRIFELLCSGVSQRRIARLLKINRKTVARKLIFLSQQVSLKNQRRFNQLPVVNKVQFDDLETIEHTKCKPLSVTLAVEKESRRILGFRVSQMPAKGHLARIAFKKYGRREDLRSQGRRDLFTALTPKIAEDALIESDENPHYKEDVRRFFPLATHQAFLGQRGSVAGQGELKKIRFDPLFSLNHTCAMLRANINRLFRKTWCTTKLPERLKDHIELYVYYHNEVLLPKSQS
jgi:transposase-like protein